MQRTLIRWTGCVGFDPEGVGVRAVGPLNDRHVPAVVQVRSCPPARQGEQRLLANAWTAGAGPAAGEELVVDLDSTVTEVFGKHKHGASYGYTGVLGYHPLIATRAGTGEVLASRMRKGAAGTSRGVIRFIDELLASLRRAGVSGPVTVRAGVGWSITVRLVTKVNNTIAAIPEEDWVTTTPAQVTPKSPKRSTPPGPGNGPGPFASLCAAPASSTPPKPAMWPTWRHHAFICDNTLTTVEADRFHRNHAIVELAIRELKDNGLEHCPSGSFPANGAWLACAVLGHNLIRWAAIIGLDGPIRTARTIRNRLIALAGVLVNQSGTPTLRLPTDWPWAHQFHTALHRIRALPTAASP